MLLELLIECALDFINNGLHIDLHLLNNFFKNLILLFYQLKLQIVMILSRTEHLLILILLEIVAEKVRLASLEHLLQGSTATAACRSTTLLKAFLLGV